MCCKNNRSALQNKTFVLEAISDLEKKGLVARCSEKPFIVSPLTSPCRIMVKKTVDS